MSNFLFTSESVSAGHPDKVADQVSDAILDTVLNADDGGRVAVETLVAKDLVVLAGQVTTTADIDYIKVAREMVRTIGYDDVDIGMDCEKCMVLLALNQQSRDISQGIIGASEAEQGAGDQGLMFGYACDETPGLMPLSVWLAHRIVRRRDQLRKDGRIPWLRPDAKSQVTMRYENTWPVGVETVILSSQHHPSVSVQELRATLIEEVIRPVLPRAFLAQHICFMVNPTGRFVIGGPAGDCGLTGRKLIVDTYGGVAPHGGGAFSGKDASKVDRSGAYAARYVAKNIVAAGLARTCLVQLSYAIGFCHPISVMVNTFGTGVIKDEKMVDLVKQIFDLRPAGIIKMLSLLKPIYLKTAVYGHFGWDEPEFSWERTDKIGLLQSCTPKRVILRCWDLHS